MFEKLYRLKGERPADDIHRLLRKVRDRDPRYNVTLGMPPFERNWLQQITAVRLRFTLSGPDVVGGRRFLRTTASN